MFRRSLYLKKLEMYLDRDVVKIVTGVRRCGKTTIIRQFIEELKESGVPEENIVYINFEGMIYSYFDSAKELRAMLSEFVQNSRGRCYIFLDEVQTVKNWANVAAELMNLFDCDITVISSNTSIFSEDFAKVLNFRYIRIDVYPLTFSEYLELVEAENAAEAGSAAQANAGSDAEATLASNADKVKGPAAEGGSGGKMNTASKTKAEVNAEAGGASEGTGEDAVNIKTRADLFIDYINKGFMPGRYALREGESANDYLSGLYANIILKDVVQSNNLRDISHIDKIMEYVLSHIGDTFSPKAVRDYVKGHGTVISVDTVYSVLEALTGAFVLYKLPRFDIKADRALETQEKYYVCDPAMRNAVMRDDGITLEAAIENAIYLELAVRGFRLYVAKQGPSQIDFMGVKGDDRMYLNCCVSIEDRQTARNEFGPLTRIKDNYFKMVLSLDPETRINRGGIINYPITDFLAQG